MRQPRYIDRDIFDGCWSRDGFNSCRTPARGVGKLLLGCGISWNRTCQVTNRWKFSRGEIFPSTGEEELRFWNTLGGSLLGMGSRSGDFLSNNFFTALKLQRSAVQSVRVSYEEDSLGDVSALRSSFSLRGTGKVKGKWKTPLRARKWDSRRSRTSWARNSWLCLPSLLRYCRRSALEQLATAASASYPR